MAGNIRKRGDTWQAKWEVRAPRGERKTRYKTLKSKTKREAERELAALITEGDRPTPPATYTVNDLIDEWLATEARNRSRRTEERAIEIAEHHLRPYIGGLRLGDLTAKNVRELLNLLRDKGRRDGKGGLSELSVRHVYRLLHQILQFALTDDPPKIATNAATHVKPPKVPTKDVEAFTEEELVIVLQGAKVHAPHYFAAFFIAAHTGVRRGELLALRWSDVDFKSGTITVARSVEQLKHSRLNIKSTKTDRIRTIALSRTALDILNTHRVEQLEFRMRVGAGVDEEGYIFPDPKTLGLQVPDRVTSQFGRLISKLDVPRYSLQALRRTSISLALANQFSPNAVAARAGHASAKMTLDVYGKAYDKEQQHLAQDMDKWAVKL